MHLCYNSGGEEEHSLLDSEWLDSSIKMIPLYFSLGGASLAYFHYLFSFETLFALKQNIIGRQVYTFLNRKWFFDKVYNEWISQTVLDVAYKNAYQGIDRGILEFLGPTGISIYIVNIAQTLKNINFSMLFSRLYFMLVFLFFCMLNIQFMGFVMPEFSIKIFYLLIFIFLLF